MKNEIKLNFPEKEYHALDRLSKHALDNFAKNPYAYFRRKQAGLPTGGEESDSTKAVFALGSAVHCAILEPARFEREFATVPEGIKVRRGKAWEEFLTSSAGKTPLKVEEMGIVDGARETLFLNAKAQETLTACAVREATVLWKHADHPAIELKSRLDFASDDFSIIGDLKTTADATPESFMKSCDSFGYDIQASFYIDAVRACGYSPKVFAFICAEKTYPFTPAVYTFDVDSDFILAGKKEYEKRLKAFEQWLNLDLSAVDAGFTAHNLELPAWSKRLKALKESI